MKKLYFIPLALLLWSFACDCEKKTNPESSVKETDSSKINIIELAILNKNAGEKIKLIESQQSNSTNVDSLFIYDELISKAKSDVASELKNAFSKIKSTVNIPFEQTKNTDKISIKSLKITNIMFNEIEVEAQVEALQNSAFNGPFAGLSAFNKSGKRLDIGGGIGGDCKLEAGKTYSFKGKIYNISNLCDFEKISFNEDIKQW